MKNLFKNIIIGTISFTICFFIFFIIMIYPNFTSNSAKEAALKNQPSVTYSPPDSVETISVKISIDGCPVDFLLKILPKNQKLNIECRPTFLINSKEKKAIGYEKSEYTKRISFSLLGFENMVNFLGGIEIETPYGLPSPAQNNEILAKDEKLFVYGASLSALFCEADNPTTERMSYYCYAFGEVSLKFLNNGNTELYKFLKKNCETDISYTDYYDNYKSLKTAIKYTDITE